jgi:hypothetical protein
MTKAKENGKGRKKFEVRMGLNDNELIDRNEKKEKEDMKENKEMNKEINVGGNQDYNSSRRSSFGSEETKKIIKDSKNKDEVSSIKMSEQDEVKKSLRDTNSERNDEEKEFSDDKNLLKASSSVVIMECPEVALLYPPSMAHKMIKKRGNCSVGKIEWEEGSVCYFYQ